jgi:hypothetical protein
MEIVFNKQEIEQAVIEYAAKKSIDVGEAKVGINWSESEYPFPHNISDMLAYCSIKAVVQVNEESLAPKQKASKITA